VYHQAQRGLDSSRCPSNQHCHSCCPSRSAALVCICLPGIDRLPRNQGPRAKDQGPM
ncbi:hypothetical protein E4U43_003400, partial [Claviceps pusilla]